MDTSIGAKVPGNDTIGAEVAVKGDGVGGTVVLSWVGASDVGA